ncbi:MAG: squalene/phytoene synthase family protein [Pseudomonadota bacterium]
MTDLRQLPVPAECGRSPQDIADEIVRKARTSFSLGLNLLAPKRRNALKAIYAFSRIVDDIADGALQRDEKTRMLEAWREEIDRCYDGSPVSPIGMALLPAIRAHELPKSEFHEIIAGMQMDVDGPITAPTKTDLDLYIRRVSGAIGLLSMRIFGAWRGLISEQFAESLARALQLTNILRDVEEDAGMGRLYLPSEILIEMGAPRDPAQIVGHPALPSVRSRLAEDARDAFDRARAAVPEHGRRSLVPALLMCGIYRSYFDKMESASWVPPFKFRRSPMAQLRTGLTGILRGG